MLVLRRNSLFSIIFILVSLFHPSALSLEYCSFHHDSTTFFAQRPVIRSRCSGYRSPCTVICEMALLISRRSSGFSSTASAPIFSSPACRESGFHHGSFSCNRAQGPRLPGSCFQVCASACADLLFLCVLSPVFAFQIGTFFLHDQPWYYSSLTGSIAPGSTVILTPRQHMPERVPRTGGQGVSCR